MSGKQSELSSASQEVTCPMGSNLLSQNCQPISSLDSEIINLGNTEVFQCNVFLWLFYSCFYIISKWFICIMLMLLIYLLI